MALMCDGCGEPSPRLAPSKLQPPFMFCDDCMTEEYEQMVEGASEAESLDLEEEDAATYGDWLYDCWKDDQVMAAHSQEDEGC